MMTIQIPDEMIPKGYKATGEFRLPNKGEAWLCAPGKSSTGLQEITPRVILRRVPQLKQIIFTIAGPPRHIKKGEWFVSSDGEEILCSKHGAFNYPRIPLTREEVWE